MRGAAAPVVVLVQVLVVFGLLTLSCGVVSAFLPTSQGSSGGRHAFIHDSSSFTTSPLTSSTASSNPSFNNNPPSQNNKRTTLSSMSDDGAPAPTTFREAEVLGLKFMQEGNYEDALKAFQTGLRCPGSRPDVKRTKSLQGPSPVGGSMGGYESQNVQTLDEFELQAAHYNMACAHAQLNQVPDAVANLQIAFDNGFDNYATVRGDPDLAAIRSTREFEKLMQQYDVKTKKSRGGGERGGGGGFNPFGLFGGGNK